MRSKISAALFGALIAVASMNLSGCSSESDNSAPLSAPVSESSANTTAASDPASSSTPSEPQKTAEEPTFLKGPAGDPIYPSDITYIDIKDENAPGGERRADLSELTEDNLAFIECENFVYLKEPTGKSYNRYESPEKFEREFPYFYIGEELVNQNPVKRVYIGEEICGMTVTGGGTSFVGHRGNASVPFWNDSIMIKFQGEKTLTGYLSVDTMTPDYSGNEGRVMFWVDEQSDPMPVADIRTRENGAETEFYNGAGFYAETLDIDLGCIYDKVPGANICDEALLDGITYGDKDVYVKITIDDYITFGSGTQRATLKSLERL